jgi:hypothetical protein
MSITLSYGNPNREYLKPLKEETYLDTLLPELQNYPPPSADSSEAQNEINAVISLCDSLYSDKVAEQRYLFYDTEFENYIINVLAEAGVSKEEVENIVKQLHDDIVPLLLKIKFHYQRIRPYQLAFYYNLPLFPYTSKTISSPSYPSGHTYQAKIYCEVLGNKYPQYYQSLQRLSEDISLSRLYLGVHYHSDIEFGKYCADLVLNHPDFKSKYKL